MSQQYIKNIIHTDQQIKSMLQLIPNNFPVCYEDLKEIFQEEKQQNQHHPISNHINHHQQKQTKSYQSHNSTLIKVTNQ